MTSQEQRINICARIEAADDTIVPDILNQKPVIQQPLINLMDRMTAPVEKGGLGWCEKRKVEITSLCRDHSPDLYLGPHGHTPGFSVDWWPSNGDLKGFVHDLIYNCEPCTKVGLGGSEAQALFPEASNGAITVSGTVVFYDNDEPHIHAQSA